MKMELISEYSEFSNSSLKSKIYEKLDYTFSGRPLYYNNESAKFVYATVEGFWVVSSK